MSVSRLDAMPDVPLITAVLPCFNEKENLQVVVDRLTPVLESVSAGSFEILFVDDGSVDGSSEMMDAFSERDPRIRVIHFSRNFGHQSALAAGLEASSGRTVVVLDADLQDPPELVVNFVDKWREGYDIVYAVRRKRKEGLLKRASYALFYRSLRFLAEIDVPLDAGDFCLMDRRVVDALCAFREQERFLRGLRSWVGFRQVGVEYERLARHAGEPKYTLRKLIKLALSGYVGFSSAPLRLAGWIGILASFVGLLIAAWAVGTKLAGVPSPRGWASTVAVILFIGGVQLLVLGVIGEYLGRVYDEVRRRPAYIVRDRVGFDSARELVRRQ